MTEIPRCCWYQSPSAFGSLARKKNPPIPVTFSISVSAEIPSRTAAPARGGESCGCVEVCAAVPSWFRLKMKFDPKANDKVRSNWRLGKSILSSVREERGPSYDTRINGVLGSVNAEVLRELSASWKSGFPSSSADYPISCLFSRHLELSCCCGFCGMQFNELFAGRAHLGPEQRA